MLTRSDGAQPVHARNWNSGATARQQQQQVSQFALWKVLTEHSLQLGLQVDALATPPRHEVNNDHCNGRTSLLCWGGCSRLQAMAPSLDGHTAAAVNDKSARNHSDGWHVATHVRASG
jgi:hypothetical protein